MDDPKLELHFHPTGRGTRGTLCARLAGTVVHTNRLDIADDVARRRFVKAVLNRRPRLKGKPIREKLESMAGDQLSARNEEVRLTQATLLVELASPAELFHDGDTAYATVEVIGGQTRHGSPAAVHRETYQINRKGFRHWLTRRFYETHRKAPGTQAMQEALEVLASKAVMDGREHKVHVRIGEHQGTLYIDLANERWEAVEVTAQGWEVVANPPVKFVRRTGMQAIPRPTRGGSIDDLRALVNAGSDDNWRLIVAWLIGALRPKGPYAVLALNGQQGSGKSASCRMLRRLIDPNEADVRSAPRDERDLMIAAINSWVAAFDNLSRISPQLSDSLCRLSTGAGFGQRALYTDDSEKLFNAARPILFNGIEEVATRPDLLERAVVLTLPTIADCDRKTEADLWREYERVRPGVLGALLDGVSTAMRNVARVRLPRPPRMVDFAAWVVAAEPALPWRGGEFLSSYAANRSEANASAMEAACIGPIIIRLLRKRSRWEGTIQELHKQLWAMTDDDTRRRFDWPVSARALAGALRRIAPAARTSGIQINFRGRGRDGYAVALERTREKRSQRSQGVAKSRERAAGREHREHRSAPHSKRPVVIKQVRPVSAVPQSAARIVPLSRSGRNGTH